MGEVVDFAAAISRGESSPDATNPILIAQDTLALALVDHGHFWTNRERSYTRVRLATSLAVVRSLISWRQTDALLACLTVDSRLRAPEFEPYNARWGIAISELLQLFHFLVSPGLSGIAC